MKTVVFLYAVIIFILCNSTGFAQNVKFGVKGGLNLTKAKYGASGHDVTMHPGTGFMPGFYIGGIAEFGFKNLERLKIQAALLYARNGVILKSYQVFLGERAIEIGESRLKTNELTLPVLAKYYVIKNLALCGGGYTGYVFDMIIENKGNVTKFESDKLNKIDVGLAIGAEYSITGGLFVDIRYNYGFADLIKFVNEGVETNMYNRFLQIGLGYKF